MMLSEIYWQIVSALHLLGITGATGYCFYCFVMPFLQKQKHAWCIGASYFLCMVFLYYIPPSLNNFTAYGIGVMVAFSVMCVLDARNLRQKIFLAITFFLLRWISGGLSLNVYDVLLSIADLPVIAAADLIWQFVIFVGMMICDTGVQFLVIWVAVRLILKVYVYKREEMTWRELILHLSPSLAIVTGYYGFQFCENVYEATAGKTLWDAYAAYQWIKNMYQVTSFGAILVIILIFQNIKDRQREDRQNELLLGQVEDMKRHIREVEKLYLDIRSLRHDMGNHVMTLENLCRNNEQQEAVKYVAGLREQLYKTDLAVKSGNPVTDVILTERKKEAQERGIAFSCAFAYPAGEHVNAFDISVILNNALSNAIEAAAQCGQSGYIVISSYRERNAYMMEIKNNFEGVLDLDSENGLPISTKEGTGHGFGLSNIRRVARKYYGDIDIDPKSCFDKAFSIFILSAPPGFFLPRSPVLQSTF